MTKRSKREKFMVHLDALSGKASRTIQSLLMIKNISVVALRDELNKMGFVLSTQSVYRWIRSPLTMNRYQSNAVAKIIGIEPGELDAAIQGQDVKIQINLNNGTVKLHPDNHTVT